MKNFKLYKAFKELIRVSYEIYLGSSQDEILKLEKISLLYLYIIKHYEHLLMSNNVDFIPLVLPDEVQNV